MTSCTDLGAGMLDINSVGAMKNKIAPLLGWPIYLSTVRILLILAKPSKATFTVMTASSHYSEARPVYIEI